MRCEPAAAALQCWQHLDKYRAGPSTAPPNSGLSAQGLERQTKGWALYSPSRLLLEPLGLLSRPCADKPKFAGLTFTWLHTA